MRDIAIRMDELKDKINDSKFLANKGLGNEVGFYIFDYDPKDELIVRNYVPNLKKFLERENSNFKVQIFDLYEIILLFFEQRGYLDKNFTMEGKKGSNDLFDKMRKALKIATNNDWIVRYIEEHLEKEAIVFIVGVGKAYPIIRSHVILNNLQTVVEDIPLVLFYPGTYENGKLQLFNKFTDDNYYRAFKITEN
ncbi:protein of unknown function [Carnobacterium iners]|uniref:DUF1788 domain-containing protein n=1 Tax=Carnobacterium iners TaxID=1073423 RepID=A0A1X7MQR5_9LACT|nr:DUF1788 domain-containing protein [Carnobacterium iners]SEL23371.1 protein of unknown function [Carnobacterium iners]SMH26313.1 protein of unknown function [Carnobacterium iners]